MKGVLKPTFQIDFLSKLSGAVTLGWLNLNEIQNNANMYSKRKHSLF